MLAEFILYNLLWISKVVNIIGIGIGMIGIFRGAITLLQLITEYIRLKSVKGAYFKTKIEVEKVRVNEEVMAHDHRPVLLTKWDRDADHFRWTRNRFIIHFSYIDYKGDPCFGHYVTVKGKRIREIIDVYYDPTITGQYVIDRGERKKDFLSVILLIGLSVLIIFPMGVYLVILKIIAIIICCSLVHDVGV